MGCGASSKSKCKEEEQKEEESPERKALLEQLAKVEQQKEEREKQKKLEEEEERVRQNAIEDAKNAAMSLASRSERFAQDLFYALGTGYIEDADMMGNALSVFKIKCCNSDLAYFDYEARLETAKMVFRDECGARMKQELGRDDAKLNRLPYSAVDLAEVLHRITYEMKVDDENSQPDIVSDFCRALIDVLLADDMPEEVADRTARASKHLIENVFVSYPTGVLDVHPEKRLQDEPEPDERLELVKPLPAKIGDRAAKLLTQYIRVVKEKGLEFEKRDLYLMRTLKLSFNKCANGGSQEKYSAALDSAVESNLVETKLFNKCPKLLKEDPLFNELYYSAYDLFDLAHSRATELVSREVFDTRLDAVDNLFDVLEHVGLYSFRLD